MMTRHIPQYWSRLGSSKSRTFEQAEVGKELILNMVMESPERTTLAFTDGPCLITQVHVTQEQCCTLLIRTQSRRRNHFPEEDLFSFENLWPHLNSYRALHTDDGQVHKQAVKGVQR